MFHILQNTPVFLDWDMTVYLYIGVWKVCDLDLAD